MLMTTSFKANDAIVSRVHYPCIQEHVYMFLENYLFNTLFSWSYDIGMAEALSDITKCAECTRAHKRKAGFPIAES